MKKRESEVRFRDVRKVGRKTSRRQTGDMVSGEVNCLFKVTSITTLKTSQYFYRTRAMNGGAIGVESVYGR